MKIKSSQVVASHAPPRSRPAPSATIRLLSIMEATTVTGPAKNLLNFCRLASSSAFGTDELPRVEVSVVTFHRRPAGSERAGTPTEGEGPNQFVAAARTAGLEVDVIYERHRFDHRIIPELRAVVERRAPDIVQTHMVKSHFLAGLAGLERARPWVAFHHGYTATDLKMHAYNQLDRWSLPRAARVITVCGPFAQQLARAGVASDRLRVRHNSITAPAPVSEGEKLALRERLGVAEGERLVLAVGRFSREKGHVDLVRALAAMRRLAPALAVKLVLVGEGPERARVAAEAHASGLAEHVIFAGHTNEVRHFYAVAEVLALPSHSEGSPNVLLEAMAAGLPVVATRVGGVPEIATDGETALLVPPRDTAALASALARLLADPALASRLGTSAQSLVITRFSPEAYARSLVSIYRDLLAAQPEAAMKSAGNSCRSCASP
jgi:glycosyltransferase involved in cell wall biosynthesis